MRKRLSPHIKSCLTAAYQDPLWFYDPMAPDTRFPYLSFRLDRVTLWSAFKVERHKASRDGLIGDRQTSGRCCHDGDG